MAENEYIQLSRDCEVVQIPSGTKATLPKGSKVRIAQSLGGTYTVMTEYGYMVRISGEDGDAIGKEKISAVPSPEALKDKSLEDLVWDQLRTCYDPEIPINIVELGLIYDLKITPLAKPEGSFKVDVKMTLTAPGCGMGDALRRDAQEKIARLPNVGEVNVELVWEPAWNQSRMSEAARLKLGIM
ncbi:MAG: putative Fe-S cluster assembly protein SufT [Candidatus Omnitrophica bacterium]|nr:putative Fe-S cluster assembly protein SufT [Candidatus Omnitrophota bacterium]